MRDVKEPSPMFSTFFFQTFGDFGYVKLYSQKGFPLKHISENLPGHGNHTKVHTVTKNCIN